MKCQPLGVIPLNNYIRTTFYRLYQTNKIREFEIREGRFPGKWAAFNTGLVDRTYHSIYALFEKNPNEDRQPWRFVSWCVSNSENSIDMLGGPALVKEAYPWYYQDDSALKLPFKVQYSGKILAEAFNPLPEEARYFDDGNEIVFDPRAKVHIDYRHVVGDCIERGRFPLSFLRRFSPSGFRWDSYSERTLDKYHELYEQSQEPDSEVANMLKGYKEALDEDRATLIDIETQFSSAVDLARRRSVWNYKTAIPIFYPKHDRISLLLPIALTQPDIIDMALVISPTDTGAYTGRTTYRLRWAYTYARTLCRPDSDWLKTGAM